MPFDRLIRAVDEWYERRTDPPEVVVQIGDGRYVPRRLKWARNLTPSEFDAHCARARVVVGHAGMGTVLTAMEHGKPLVLLPRRGSLRETRNDHQLATARWLAGRPGIFVASETAELAPVLDLVLDHPQSFPTDVLPVNREILVARLRSFIDRA